MTIEQFADHAEIVSTTEVDRACQLAFYHMKCHELTEFTVNDICEWLSALSLPSPNRSRLEQRLTASQSTIKGSSVGRFKLRREYIQAEQTRFPEVGLRSQVVIDKGSLLPEILYSNTRGYIVSLAKQINASYENNIFDGCAVLMRRLEEVLLISAYEHLGLQSSIKNLDGTYVLLEAIVRNAAGNASLNLSRNSRQFIEVIRELGNYSAHKITYTCKREYISEKVDGYRALVDELLHKAGLKI